MAAATLSASASRLIRGVAGSLMRRHVAQDGAVVLHRRRIYILPTKQGLLFTATLAVLLIGSINYSLNLGFVLTFLLGGVAMMAILHTFRNLVGIRLSVAKAAPVFAGSHANFVLSLANTDRIERYTIELDSRAGVRRHTDLPANGAATVGMSVAAERRGWLPLGSVTLHTRYPLGLFRAWAHAEFGERCLVYPRPDDAAQLPSDWSGDEGGVNAIRGDTDFSGLRPYRPGDPLPHIAWKASAREQGLLTKTFTGARAEEVWLDWRDLPMADIEARLSRLTRWVLLAENAGLRYGLRLPGARFAPARGAQHLESLLTALALYGAES